jgi:hypothetical protein
VHVLHAKGLAHEIACRAQALKTKKPPANEHAQEKISAVTTSSAIAPTAKSTLERMSMLIIKQRIAT